MLNLYTDKLFHENITIKLSKKEFKKSKTESSLTLLVKRGKIINLDDDQDLKRKCIRKSSKSIEPYLESDSKISS